MTSANEKVKDLIEVRAFCAVRDFHSDPSATLDAYRFTDITSGLMASWLDSVSRSASSGPRMRALAGYRGVGKSHFIASFGAVIGNPELRAGLQDSHVALSANGLLRRRYPVAYVQRGSGKTLIEELRSATAHALGIPLEGIPSDPDQLLEKAASEAGDMPFVILVDTAQGRKARVKRDDGAVLGEFASAASERNVFIGVALDDDITEADGTNAAIVRHFSIDYLDQEHLYRIVDRHIFPKNRAKHDVLDDAYSYFRKVLPGFQWSQQRFASLYPLHPLILEVAPVVRLYAPEFALLSFASDAGKRILGRPSRSLIGLDEVFDCVEKSLRNVEDLQSAFDVFDRVSSEISNLVPVFQRLQAKLILKALFILSLEGEGVTAQDLSAAILIYEENDPGSAEEKVSELLEIFVSAFPDLLWRIEGPDSETRYSLKVAGKDNLNRALAAAMGSVPEDSVPDVLKRCAKDRFPDWPFSAGAGTGGADHADIQVQWRGSLRKIRVYWNWQNDEYESIRMLGDESGVDLQVILCGPGDEEISVPPDTVGPVLWVPAEPTSSESETLKKYHLLLHDEAIKAEFHEQLGPAGHTHTVAAEKIWMRLFLTGSKLISSDGEIRIPVELIAEPSLAGLLSGILAPVFEEAYPEHPSFDQPLGMREVSSLVSDLFSGARVAHQEVQQLAQMFAEPLGLVSRKGENLVLEKEEALFDLHLVEKVLSLVGQNGGETVPLQAVYKRLREKPYGLARESQHLILSALVAQGKIEFVTKKGDRINRRSLDLRIIWDDIAGVSKPKGIVYESARLTDWVRILTGTQNVQSIDIADDRRTAKDALQKWLGDWKSEKVLENFDALHSDQLNTKIWRVAVSAEKSFGAVADTLEAFFEGAHSLEESLQRIADAFGDSETEYEIRKEELVTVASFVEGAGLRESVTEYLSLCEYTDKEDIEDLRRGLEKAFVASLDAPGGESNSELAVGYDKFRHAYAAFYSDAHARVAGAHELQEKVDEILASDEWWEFFNLASLPLFKAGRSTAAETIVNELKGLSCRIEIEEEITHRPYCGCSFRIHNAGEWQDKPRRLIEAVLDGSDGLKRTLRIAADVIDPILGSIADSAEDPKVRAAAERARTRLRGGEGGPMYTTDEIHQLRAACGQITNAHIVKARLPHFGDYVTADELRNRLESWLAELPGDPIFLDL